MIALCSTPFPIACHLIHLLPRLENHGVRQKFQHLYPCKPACARQWHADVCRVCVAANGGSNTIEVSHLFSISHTPLVCLFSRRRLPAAITASSSSSSGAFIRSAGRC